MGVKSYVRCGDEQGPGLPRAVARGSCKGQSTTRRSAALLFADFLLDKLVKVQNRLRGRLAGRQWGKAARSALERGRQFEALPSGNDAPANSPRAHFLVDDVAEGPAKKPGRKLLPDRPLRRNLAWHRAKWLCLVKLQCNKAIEQTLGEKCVLQSRRGENRPAPSCFLRKPTTLVRLNPSYFNVILCLLRPASRHRRSGATDDCGVGLVAGVARRGSETATAPGSFRSARASGR